MKRSSNLRYRVLCGAFATLVAFIALGAEGCSTHERDALHTAAAIAKFDAAFHEALLPRAPGLGFSTSPNGFVSEGHRSNANALAVTAPSRAGARWTLAPGGATHLAFQVEAENVRDVAGELSEGRIVYRGVMPHTDAIVSSNTTSVEMFYLLHGKDAPRKFSYRVTLPSVAGAVETKHDGLWFYDQKHVFMLHVPSPYARDANGRNIAMSLAWDETEHTVTATLEPNDVESTYPLLVDPAFESLAWSEVRTPRSIAAANMTYDEKRSVFLVTQSHETWLNKGGLWSEYVPSRGETSLSFAHYRGQAYDRDRDRTVLFGGLGGIVPNGETWLWDGAHYIRAQPPTSAPARCMHAMVYDTVRKEVVLFGGISDMNSGTPLADTWVWNGVTWTKKNPQHRPPARSRAVMVFDEARGKAVLFGGSASWTSKLEDTYTWDGTDWTEIPMPTHPERRSESMGAYDRARNRVIVFGGRRADEALLSDTWSFDGQSWTEESPLFVPPATSDGTMGYDAASKTILLVGGYTRTTTGESLQSDFWRFNGTTWQKEAVGNAPEKPQNPALVRNPNTNELLMYMGRDDDAGWAYIQGGWSRRDYRPAPSMRVGQGVAADVSRQEVVMFGGANDTGFLGDTWIAAGTRNTFVRMKPTTSPSPRNGHRLAYDRLRKTMVLFGGRDASRFLNDTWLWDGTNWRKAQPATSPTPRAFYGLAFDDPSGDIFLVGGEGDSGSLTDTWRWNGSNWTSVPSGNVLPDEDAVLFPSSVGCILVQSSGRQARWSEGSQTWQTLGVAAPSWTFWSNYRAATAAHGAASGDRAVLLTSSGTRVATLPNGAWTTASFLSDAFGPAAARPWTPQEPYLAFAGNAGIGSFSTASYVLSESWDAWREVSDPSTYPTGTIAADYDTNRERALIVSRNADASPGTYTWDGVELIRVDTQPFFTMQEGHSTAFDTARGTLVLATDDGDATLSTYLLSGTDWVKQAGVAALKARRWSAMAYDQVRQNVVLFGGDARGVVLQDTWLWNGTTWTNAQPKTKPPARSSHALTFHPGRKTVLMFGGFGASAPLQDTWEWDGTDWVELRTRVSPPARGLHAFAVDPASRKAVLFAGGAITQQFHTAWALESRGSGCTTTGDCVSGTCVDGVCCESAQCGTCETCAGSDPGKCTKVTNATDPDSCAASSKSSCDANGVCRPGLGSTCAKAEDCSSGFCVDGLCCDTSCDRPCEACSAAAKQTGRDDGICGPARATTNPGNRCAEGATCSVRGVCETKTGQTCIADRYEEGADGKRRDCAPYRCAAACLTACSSANDCIFPSTCAPEGKCVPPPEPLLNDGCSVHSSRSRSEAVRAIMALMVLGALLRRRGGSARV